MKNPLLIMFVILNLLAVNLVLAMDISNESLIDAHHQHSQTDFSAEELLVSCVGDTNCDHFCHISSHMLGLISQFAALPQINEAVVSHAIKQHFPSLIVDPPFQPPWV